MRTLAAAERDMKKFDHGLHLHLLAHICQLTGGGGDGGDAIGTGRGFFFFGSSISCDVCALIADAIAVKATAASRRTMQTFI